ncbi:c-type cytochrome [Rufibacter latericius]|uniref:Cytochrome c n=1 Tax=Rufibacter latericius TaxID=2487040 RepID=A0A3M9MKG2_9BACT|nr:cytochrome c [Rufibacter latericius]RNI25971.1 cytochrome c [Rufibacter latericius]
MTTAFLHIHVLVVVLFLILFLIKAFQLFLNKHNSLNRTRSSTKMLDIVLGSLMLVSGGFLAFNYNGPLPTWLLVKVLLVLGAIPLSIVGIKRHSKLLTAVGVLIFLYVYGVAETKSLKMRPDKGEAVAVSPAGEVGTASPDPEKASHPILAQLEGTQLENTKAIYTALCANCHGEDGQKGTGGAVNLQKSTLGVDGCREVIANGRGLMPGFGSQLSEQEIEALALYSTMLKK